MPLFSRFRSAKSGADDVVDNAKSTPKSEPYKHIPTHAARDARSQVPPSAREHDREAIAEHHKRRSQMSQQYSPVLKISTLDRAEAPTVSNRDVPYVGKEKAPRTSRRPSGSLTELNHLQTQRKTRASRRAAHIEPTAEVAYHIGLLPSPLVPAVPTLDIPVTKSAPLPADDARSSCDSEVADCKGDSAASGVGKVQPLGPSVVEETTTGRNRSTSSEESLNIPPSRGHTRDSLSLKMDQDFRFHNPNGVLKKSQRLRAAHDKTGLEDAMAKPESFQPRRAPPIIVRNDSAYPSLPVAAFDFGTERPYLPDRLRPWLAGNKHNAFQYMSTVNTV